MARRHRQIWLSCWYLSHCRHATRFSIVTPHDTFTPLFSLPYIMRFTLATVIAAFPFLVIASPTPLTSPTKISLNKRTNLKQQDGSVNATNLRAHTAASVAKIQRGFAVHLVDLVTLYVF